MRNCPAAARVGMFGIGSTLKVRLSERFSDVQYWNCSTAWSLNLRVNAPIFGSDCALRGFSLFVRPKSMMRLSNYFASQSTIAETMTKGTQK